MRVNVGEIPYLNSAPFYWDKSETGSGGSFNWRAAPPKELGRMARAGQVDAGPFSMVDAFGLENEFERLGQFCIAAKSAAKSVLLFSKVGLGSLNGARIGLTEETATSSELLKVLMSKRHGILPTYVEGFSDNDQARLLIGDAALNGLSDASLNKQFPVIMDLGEEWQRWQNLPFVFACWMVRKNAAESDKRGLLGLLERNVSGAERNMETALAGVPVEGRARAREYLSAFRYRMGEPEKRAVEVFRALLREVVAAAR